MVGGTKVVVVVVVRLFTQVSLLKIPSGRFLAKQNLPVELENTGELGRHTWNNPINFPITFTIANVFLVKKTYLNFVRGELLNCVKCTFQVHHL